MRLAADAWAIGSVNWYAPSSNLKLMFDRVICMNGGNPRMGAGRAPEGSSPQIQDERGLNDDRTLRPKAG